MNFWYHVQQISRSPDGPAVPVVPTFVWLNTAYYARQRAEVYYGSPAQDMIVVLVKPNYVFPNNAVELVDCVDGTVRDVQLRDAREREDPPLKRTNLRKMSPLRRATTKRRGQ
jgi:hypothetical protein